MTPEELELKERDVSAREKANELTERSLNIEERKSKLNFWGMIATAFIGLSGVVFGLLYVNDQKNQDLTALHKKIDKLHDNDCSKELAQQRFFMTVVSLVKSKIMQGVYGLNCICRA